MADDRVWFALMHTPGPAVPQGESVFDQPGIAEHYAFLRRRAEAGELVAAGPLLDVNGAGMTVLDVETAEEAQRLAATDDQAVAVGLLNVIVRPWRVVMTRL
ncbi:MAG: YciI family protein [Pseudonocardiales bacterium]